MTTISKFCIVQDSRKTPGTTIALIDIARRNSDCGHWTENPEHARRFDSREQACDHIARNRLVLNRVRAVSASEMTRLLRPLPPPPPSRAKPAADGDDYARLCLEGERHE